ncbi:MAG: hypothetical protein HKM90_00735 [Desulfobacteraceae bacterium]|nr:hypothetical protein [Desulfobacteraceae bacterium]
MRFFHLLNLQHIVLFLFPTLIFIVLLYMGLSRAYFQTRDSEEREKRVVHTYPDGLAARNSPFPLILILIIIGFLLWGAFYAIGIGILGVKI